jgi:hypothetical protein
MGNEMETATDPMPGIYNNISDDNYHAGPGVSNSGLRVIAEYSPAHYIAQKAEPRVETPAKTEGKRIHRAILEPVRFETEYVALPADAPSYPTKRQWESSSSNESSQYAKDWWTDWNATNGNRVCVPQDSFDRCLRIRDAVHREPEVRRLLATGAAERSIYARDPITGVLVRARPDHDHDTDAERTLLDLKSAEDARPDVFEWSFWRYGYFQQAPFYMDVAEWCGVGRVPDRFVICAFEKQPPFGLRVYDVKPDSLRRGRESYRAALDTYAECVRTGIWPGYPSGITQIGIPAAIERKLDAAQNDEIEAISYDE